MTKSFGISIGLYVTYRPRRFRSSKLTSPAPPQELSGTHLENYPSPLSNTTFQKCLRFLSTSTIFQLKRFTKTLH